MRRAPSSPVSSRASLGLAALGLCLATGMRLPARAANPPPLPSMGAVRPAQFLPPTESGVMVPSVPVGGLPRARECAASLPVFGHPDNQYWPPHGAIAMSNDGGWCWLQFVQTFRAAVILPEAAVVERPAHGELDVTRMADRISMAYRPAPGFTGTDHFAVRTDGPLAHTIPVEVTVR